MRRRPVPRKRSTVKAAANPTESSPLGSARLAVRGLRRSNSRSAIRFMVMAAERAPTMATMIQRSWRHVGNAPAERAASSAPTSAKGSAKTECSNLIISSTMRMRFLVISSEPMPRPERRLSSDIASLAAGRAALGRGMQTVRSGRLFFLARSRRRASRALRWRRRRAHAAYFRDGCDLAGFRAGRGPAGGVL